MRQCMHVCMCKVMLQSIQHAAGRVIARYFQTDLGEQVETRTHFSRICQPELLRCASATCDAADVHASIDRIRKNTSAAMVCHACKTEMLQRLLIEEHEHRAQVGTSQDLQAQRSRQGLLSSLRATKSERAAGSSICKSSRYIGLRTHASRSELRTCTGATVGNFTSLVHAQAENPFGLHDTQHVSHSCTRMKSSEH